MNAENPKEETSENICTQMHNRIFLWYFFILGRIFLSNAAIKCVYCDTVCLSAAIFYLLGSGSPIYKTASSFHQKSIFNWLCVGRLDISLPFVFPEIMNKVIP